MRFFTASRLNKMKTNFRAGDIDKAIAYADKINPAEVRTTYDLSMMADVYMSVERYGAARRVYVELYKKNRSIRVCKQLVDLNLKMKNVKQAIYYVKELCALDPEDYERFIFKYKIGKMLNQSDGYLIDCLKKVREADYIDKWALELAKLFYKTGKTEKCIKECQNIKLWFPDTEYAEKADRLLDACNSGITYEETMAVVQSDEAAYTTESNTYENTEEETEAVPEVEITSNRESDASEYTVDGTFENEISEEKSEDITGVNSEDYLEDGSEDSDDWNAGWATREFSDDDWEDEDDWEDSGDVDWEDDWADKKGKKIDAHDNSEEMPSMTEISMDEEQIYFDLSESVKGVMREENESFDERPDIATTLINDSLTNEVLEALHRQDENENAENNDAIDESILKMINED